MGKQAFEKFIKSEPAGAKKKEMIRQEKRKIKKDAREAGEAFRQKKYQERFGHQQPEKETRDKKFVVKKNAHGRDDSNTQRYNKEDKGDRPSWKKDGANKTRKPVAIVKDGIKGSAQKPWGARPDDRAKQAAPDAANVSSEIMPLNKFVAHAGVCARREAAEMVKHGKVTVNGEVVTEPGFKVSAADKIKVNGKLLFLQHNPIYILLNKPKDYITTVKDPEGRKTVADLVKHATTERVYPVGRLDRNTTGVLLLTNDGELAQKLTHPSFEVKKIYEVTLDKPLVKKDFEAILNGITLEDGLITADMVAYADSKDKSIIGIEIHSGRNRIVRRMFEHLGYDVRNLDRVMFANLTKKNVDRGKWRLLSEKEVRLLKYMNQSFIRKNKLADNIDAED